MKAWIIVKDEAGMEESFRLEDVHRVTETNYPRQSVRIDGILKEYTVLHPQSDSAVDSGTFQVPEAKQPVAERYRFEKGDRIRVLDKKDGRLIKQGEALHSRTYFGLAEFQVLSDEGWAYSFNLNFVDVEKVS